MNPEKVQISILLFSISFFCYFFLWLGLYKTGRNQILIQSEDAIPATYLPFSVIKGNGFYLDEYYNFFNKHWPNHENSPGKLFYLLEIPERGLASAFTVVAPVLALPFYLPISTLGINYKSPLVPITAHFAASFYVSLSVVFVYLILLAVTKKPKESLLAAIAYAFGSICFGLTSQSLWQHGINQMLLSLGTLLLIKNKPVSALAFSLAVFSRPPNIVFAIWACVYVLLKNRKTIISFLLWGLPPLILQLAYNALYLGGVFNYPYKDQQFVNWQGRFPEGFLGLLFSPSKGILVISPIFILSFIGVFRLWKSKGKTEFKLLSLSILALFLVMGKWIHWFGGWSFGYRMVSESLPFLTIFLVFFLVDFYKFPRWRSIFYLLLAFSITMQLSSLFFDFREWHTIYDNGPYNTAWLWSIRDSMPIYFLRLALAKFSLSL
ncbi:hypothetical protein COT49_01090 [candidate division WWE3 bacterium CG08_land_8_20_14_0_20_40_13]|uniref:Glycosyltransferase RgtA/B/C/D-like domain-containing protein n=1 Tax=candidate division WWE3 bacterium CG08_land_8_20_14_0_20_40_13 TaxID=1975084 RepID=A0A2H0XEC6_UNCKA|nr:MAG: hypothetical protein COT49_01090 [candidate division WWE3 bacterium CG08_land_8_20_14_0_20_40_13]